MPASEEFAASIRIDIGGAQQKDLVNDIIMLVVEDSIENPSTFNLVLADREGKWADSSLLSPEVGGDIKIYLGYTDASVSPLFVGKVVALSPDFSSGEARTLSVQGYDRSFFLQKTHCLKDNSNVQNGQDASTLVKKIAGNNGLSSDVGSAGFTWADVVLTSPDESDYSILRRVADMTSLEFFVRDRTLTLRKPDYGDNAATLVWGTDIISMSFRMSTGRLVKSATVRGYNPKDKCSYTAQVTTGESGTFSGTLASKYVSSSEFSSLILEQDVIFSNLTDVNKLAGALLDRANNSFVEGRCVLIGDPKIRSGRSVVINGAGKRFSGSYYIKSARHSVDKDGYLLSLELRSMVTQKV
ncbi:MAG: Phage late control gene D protein (GPD) [Methanosaeta sp. PtaU1.Bin060]|nr:MAG: Phage late control gene D protein (GPD) [Methanosaeta sp. PtaU1.Bin060]